MAGDWIKVEKSTARKPEVLRIADILGIHPDHAFGLCVRFWQWCDDQLTDGHARGVTIVTLDSVFGHAGFVPALVEVGWLLARNGAASGSPVGSLEVPHFDRHLSESAKNRALSGERKKKQRSKTVPEMSRQERDKSVTREEKRREDSSQDSNPSKKGASRFVEPSLDEVAEYCLERKNGVDPQAFVDFYASKGWKVGNQPMKDWQAAVRTWEKRDAGPGTAGQNANSGGGGPSRPPISREQQREAQQHSTIADWARRKTAEQSLLADGVRYIDGPPVRDEANSGHDGQPA